MANTQESYSPVDISGVTVSENLAKVNGSSISLGQAAMSASLPVAIASNQSNLNVVGVGTAGTPSGGVISVQGVASGTAVPVSGTVTANAGTGTFTVSGTVTANAGTGNFNVIGTGTAGTPATGVVTVQGIASGTAIPVSGTVTANAGTGNFNVVGTGTAGTPATGVVSVQGIASGTALSVSLASGATVNIFSSVAGTAQQAVTASAVALPNTACKTAVVKNDDASTQDIFLGASGVTTSTGFRLKAGQSITVNISNTDAIFVIAASTGATADVISFT